MLRVLQVIHAMNLGGAENFIMNIYRNIDRSRVQFDFLVSRQGGFDDEIRQLGGQIWRVPYVNTVGPIKYRMELLRFFSEHPEYQLVHSHLDMVSGEVVSCAKKTGSRYCITHSHNTDTTGNFAVKIVKRYYQRKIVSYADWRLACSEQAGKWLYGDQVFVVVNNAIQMEKFFFDETRRVALRKQYHIPENVCVIGHVGRFSRVKNHSFLVRLFKHYVQKHSDSVLLFCGDGEEKETIQRQVSDWGLKEKVIFCPASTEVYNMYQMMDVFVFPSYYEGMSLVMVEAQTNGLPIVASDSIDPKSALTSNVSFVNLKGDLAAWEREIDVARKRGRCDEREKIEKAGFDVRKAAGILQECYLQRGLL